MDQKNILIWTGFRCALQKNHHLVGFNLKDRNNGKEDHKYNFADVLRIYSSPGVSKCEKSSSSVQRTKLMQERKVAWPLPRKMLFKQPISGKVWKALERSFCRLTDVGLHRALKQGKGSEIPQSEQMLSYMKHEELFPQLILWKTWPEHARGNPKFFISIWKSNNGGTSQYTEKIYQTGLISFCCNLNAQGLICWTAMLTFKHNKFSSLIRELQPGNFRRNNDGMTNIGQLCYFPKLLNNVSVSSINLCKERWSLWCHSS